MKLTLSLSAYLFLGLISVLNSASARADFVFLRPESIDLRRFPPPPAPGSREDERDLDGVRAFQKTRTNAECRRATDEANISVMSFFGQSHAVLSPAEARSMEDLFVDIGGDTTAFSRQLKDHYGRIRPYQRDPQIILCVPTVGGFAYPSGHAALGRVAARVFGLIFPRRISRLLDRGDEIGIDRVLGGVHHPRDIEAGRLLGDQIFRALLKSPEFMRRIEDLRAHPLRPSRRRLHRDAPFQSLSMRNGPR